MLDTILLILCYFLGGLISLPVDMLAAVCLFQLCWGYQDRPVFTLTNPFLLSDVCIYFCVVFTSVKYLGVLFVFIDIFFHPQSEATVVEEGLGVAEIWKYVKACITGFYRTYLAPTGTQKAVNACLTPMNIDGWF